MDKKKILIDVDDVIGNDEAKQKFYTYFRENNCYDYATIFPNAYEVIKKLNNEYDVLFFR